MHRTVPYAVAAAEESKERGVVCLFLLSLVSRSPLRLFLFLACFVSRRFHAGSVPRAWISVAGVRAARAHSTEPWRAVMRAEIIWGAPFFLPLGAECKQWVIKAGKQPLFLYPLPFHRKEMHPTDRNSTGKGKHFEERAPRACILRHKMYKAKKASGRKRSPMDRRCHGSCYIGCRLTPDTTAEGMQRRDILYDAPIGSTYRYRDEPCLPCHTDG